MAVRGPVISAIFSKKCAYGTPELGPRSLTRGGRVALSLAKVGLHIDLNREGDLVQHVGGFVNPTALVPGAWEGLFDCLPEAERAVADREVGRNLEPTLLDVEQELTPALRTLAHPGLEARRAPSCPRVSRRSCIRRPLPSGPAGRPRRPSVAGRTQSSEKLHSPEEIRCRRCDS
jgi:hypothetical protein